jgi:hypothetical protein
MGTPAPFLFGSLPTDPALDRREAPPRATPPKGVMCAVYGSGTSLRSSCDPHMTEVSSARAGGRPMARFHPEGVDVAWGVFRGRGRGWVHVEDGTFVLDGFADLSKETFTLLREVDIVEDHVWLKQGIPVGVLGADDGGVAVSFTDSLPGVVDIAARVPCDAILYDPAPAPDAAPSAVPPREPESTFAAVPRLRVHTAPDGRELTTLGRANEPLALALEVVERREAWTRVRFETDSTRFDVWARSLELDADTGHGLGLFGSACGGIGSSHHRSPARTVKRRTPVVAGNTPGGAAFPGLALVAGASVVVGERRGGFLEVSTPHSHILPPEGARFWIPASALEGSTDEE